MSGANVSKTNNFSLEKLGAKRVKIDNINHYTY